MVKFLKFVLFIIIMAFAFALGVRFSDSFKGKMGNLGDDELKIEAEMDKAFDNVKKETETTDDMPLEAINPLTEEEKNEVNNTTEVIPEYVNIEITEPMDGVSDNAQPEATTQNVENLNVQDNNVAPVQEAMPKQPVQAPAPTPVAPATANQNAQQAPVQANKPVNTQVIK